MRVYRSDKKKMYTTKTEVVISCRHTKNNYETGTWRLYKQNHGYGNI